MLDAIPVIGSGHTERFYLHDRTESMHILFLNSAKRGWGGNEKSILIAAEALAESDTVMLAYRSDIVGNRFSIRKFKLPFLFDTDLVTIFSLVTLVKKHRIAVIIATKRKDYVLGGITALLCGIPNIIWLGANRELDDTILNKLIYKHLASGIIVNAQLIKKTLLKTPFMQQQMIRVIYNGIDNRKLDLATTREKKKPDIFTVTAMGRLDRNKGFDFLLKSFARFLSTKQGIDAQLVIIGEGPYREEYESLAKQLHLQDKVIFTGFLIDPYPELLISDVYASTSITEGLSIALLEAMYLSNAPISTFAGGGVTEIIEHGKNGFLIEYGNEVTLSEILMNFYENKDLQKSVAEQARQSVKARYHIEKMVAELSKFCHEAIKAS